jgi:N-acetylglutamate synthase-like GNAT family acetyltransferase
MATIKLRVARSNEAQAIFNLIRCAFNDRRPYSSTNFGSTREVEQLITKGVFLVADRDGTIIGCAYLEPSREATRLELLAVCPEYQRTGIGSQLMEVAEDMSRTLQSSFVQVRVLNMSQPVLTFCRRRGYVDFGIEPIPTDSSPVQHCHLVSMAKQLDRHSRGF